MHLQESGEMYLETIYILSQRGGQVRSIDVCEYMNFSKPSVSRAVGILKRGGYLLSDDVLLFGWVRGEPPKKRHMLVEHIREYLSRLQSDPDFQTEIAELGEGLAISKKL